MINLCDWYSVGIFPAQWLSYFTNCSLLLLDNRMSNFFIRVGNTFNEAVFNPVGYDECWYENNPIKDRETRQFTCPQVKIGRYVVIHFTQDSTEPLSLCEVQVYSDIGK